MRVTVKTKYLRLVLMVWFLFLGGGYLSTADAVGYDLRIISSGETQYIDVATEGLLSLGDVHILNVVVVGSGELGIGMEKTDTGGELIMMTGVATSTGGGTSTFFKTGFTPNALSAAVEIGDENNSNGFLFMVTGVLFSLGKVGEGEYSIELAF